MYSDVKFWGSILAACIAGLVALYNFNRQIESKSVADEREKWREKMKELSSKLVKNSILLHSSQNGNDDENSGGKIKAELIANLAELRLRLNPFDTKDEEEKGFCDQEILELANQLLHKSDDETRNAFLAKMELLLKREWEKAKKDTLLFRIFWRLGSKKDKYKKEWNLLSVLSSLFLVEIFVFIFSLIFSTGVKNG